MSKPVAPNCQISLKIVFFFETKKVPSANRGTFRLLVFVYNNLKKTICKVMVFYTILQSLISFFKKKLCFFHYHITIHNLKFIYFCLRSSMVEQGPFKPLVVGSSPSGGTIPKKE